MRGPLKFAAEVRALVPKICRRTNEDDVLQQAGERIEAVPFLPWPIRFAAGVQRDGPGRQIEAPFRRRRERLRHRTLPAHQARDLFDAMAIARGEPLVTVEYKLP